MKELILLNDADAIHPRCIAKIMQGEKLPKGGGYWSVGNELKPADLYLYLYARFGAPNGLQNLFRRDDSDNLIHWDWTLACERGLIQFYGLNLRTEIWFHGDWDLAKCDREQFISHIKADFSNYGKEMSQLRKSQLEDWEIFVNPYKQTKDAILQLKSDLDALQLKPDQEKVENPTGPSAFARFASEWEAISTKYNRGIGLALSLRTMIPILAESFLNMLLFVLCHPDIKKNQRLFDAAIRANIDVKVQSLHINCIGFSQPVDWSAEPCKKYNSIVNARNDLLHGNVSLANQKFSEIFFNGKVPVFKKYESMWQQSIGVAIDSSKLSEVGDELITIDQFTDYVLSCIDPQLLEQVTGMLDKRDLGMNKKDSRLGILLPDHLIDFGVSLFDTNVKPGH